MKIQSVMLEEIFSCLLTIERKTNEFLSDISKEKNRRAYRDDILQLSSTDVFLLASYYINANVEAKEKFRKLLLDIYGDFDQAENFMTELKKIYDLNIKDLAMDIQYGAAKRVVLEFVNMLKDDAMADLELNPRVEKEYADRLFIVRKLMRYYSSKPGSVEIKNIDDFILMLNILKLSNIDKNKALMIAIENNSKFYSRSITRLKKRKTDFLDDDSE